MKWVSVDSREAELRAAGDQTQTMSTSLKSGPPASPGGRPGLPVRLVVLTLLMFGQVLFAPEGVVLSNKDRSDLLDQYSHWRQFGFGQLRSGHLPLWNPHVFCGAAPTP